MTDMNNTALAQVPARLKTARKDKGLSLEAVAKLSGVSKSMLSQIERGESSPTIATLWNLTRALQVDFSGLMDDDIARHKIDVLRASTVPTINTQGTGCSIHILSPPETVGQHEIYELRFSSGGILDSQPHARGTTEHLTVIEGQVEITSGARTEMLNKGDTARYAADVPHKIKTQVAARLFLIVSGE
jgi:transcriptional regulator with XRE-family HTH domain